MHSFWIPGEVQACAMEVARFSPSLGQKGLGYRLVAKTSSVLWAGPRPRPNQFSACERGFRDSRTSCPPSSAALSPTTESTPKRINPFRRTIISLPCTCPTDSPGCASAFPAFPPSTVVVSRQIVPGAALKAPVDRTTSNGPLNPRLPSVR